MKPLQTQAHGTSMIEVLVTLMLLSFGVLGVATLLSKLQLAQMESYQRAQAVLLVSDMVGRINSQYGSASSYVTTSALGVGDAQPASCTALATGAARDACEWSNALNGAAELKGASRIGAMIGARGCVEQLQAANIAAGFCTPAVYRVSVVWQGLNKTAAPPAGLSCGSGLFGDESLRRAVTLQLAIGISQCS